MKKNTLADTGSQDRSAAVSIPVESAPDVNAEAYDVVEDVLYLSWEELLPDAERDSCDASQQTFPAHTESRAEDGTNSFLREIRQSPPLSEQEKATLPRLAFQGDLKARDRLVEAYAFLVPSVAEAYKDKGLPLDDLIGAGMIGLLEAAGRFNPEKSNNFVSFAKTYIRYKILGEFTNARMIHLPNEKYSIKRKFDEAAEHLAQEFGRSPTTAEIADYLGYDIVLLGKVLLALEKPLSIHAHEEDDADDGYPLKESIADPSQPDPQDMALQADMQSEVFSVLQKSLTEQEYQVISKLFGFQGEVHTYKEIEQVLGLKSGAAERIEKKALKKLKHPKVRQQLISYAGRNPALDLEKALYQLTP